MRAIAITTGLALLLASAATAQPIREIVVTGEGRVDAAPDMATVTGGVESQAESAAAALAGNGEAARAVLAALEDAGVARRDIQTSHLGLEPVYRQDENGAWTPEVVGYIARNTLSVRVREIEGVGDVIDRMSEAGVNRIEGITFAIANPRPLLDEARKAAVEDGRARAELFAEAAGVELGHVLSLRETQPIDQPPYPVAMRAEAMDGAIAEGTMEVSTMVEIVFAIEGEGEGESGTGSGPEPDSGAR